MSDEHLPECIAFNFFGLAKTSLSCICVFVDKSKKYCIPLVVSPSRFFFIEGYLNGLLNIATCGLYSSFLYLLYKYKLCITGIYMIFNKEINTTFSKLIVMNKNGKIDKKLSNFLILLEEAIFLSIVISPPLLINDKNTLDTLAFSIEGVDENNILDMVKEKITLIENEIKTNTLSNN